MRFMGMYTERMRELLRATPPSKPQPPTMLKSKPSSLKPSQKLATALAQATPQQRADAAKIAANLLARRAKRESSGKPIDLTSR
ncbi:MAG: hypothetical protein V4844_16995 [Pseudomonadota bacterium]